MRKLVDAEDENDPKVHELYYYIMRDFIQRDKNWLCTAKRLSDGKIFGVACLGEGSISSDLEELTKKDIPVPEYLANLPSALTGPDIFEFMYWWDNSLTK